MTNRHACYRHRRWQRRPVWWPAWANRRKGGRKQLDSKDAQDAQDTGGSSRLLHRPRAWMTAGVLAFWRSGGVRAGRGRLQALRFDPFARCFAARRPLCLGGTTGGHWLPAGRPAQTCVGVQRLAGSCRRACAAAANAADGHGLQGPGRGQGSQAQTVAATPERETCLRISPARQSHIAS